MNKQQQIQAKVKQAFSASLSPLTQNVMMLLMAWIMGSSVSYISIMFTFMLVSNFFASLSKVNEVFAKFDVLERGMLLIFKGLYILCSSTTLLLAIYKFSNMGILPNKPSDFIPSLSVRVVCSFFDCKYLSKGSNNKPVQQIVI
ncbi:hypothetical protein EIN_053000 [Entamoeba invadens IP1]|uniref:hypothetical protein n=1 Tax=Entamoeba invadens IP1 TaxID=370355 RepID=UPI0002C3EC7A|nr:hypothetical protein EIN_053000 [Entamoeba invadens IP1]ELP93075.1 hypothetical protein EIN_053000 [Entamoeba invadens IP1]|eukprot:XP_004259846.1 hypothetical protein EIN_053000 [Entamoeba invadens IP1]